jgi:hypothetical protein
MAGSPDSQGERAVTGLAGGDQVTGNPQALGARDYVASTLKFLETRDVRFVERDHLVRRVAGSALAAGGGNNHTIRRDFASRSLAHGNVFRFALAADAVRDEIGIGLHCAKRTDGIR